MTQSDTVARSEQKKPTEGATRETLPGAVGGLSPVRGFPALVLTAEQNAVSSGGAQERPPLAQVLLWNFSLLMAAAVALAIITAFAAQALEPGFVMIGVFLLLAADIGILFVFGRYLIGRLILGPLDELRAAADDIAAGNLERRAPSAETRELDFLAAHLNGMTEALLDTRSHLVRVEKLAGAGRLAAGVAHEIGNPLAALQTYLQVLGKRGADQDIISSAAAEIERIERIVRGLLSYARPEREETGVIRPEVVVQRAVALLREQGALRGSEIRLTCDDDLPPVRGRTHALEQVMVNLLLNAVDAAPGGPLSVGVQSCQYNPAHAGGSRRTDTLPTPARRSAARRPRRPDVPVGTAGALIWVADSGPGVPEEQRELVFDPFFTTKEPGLGTGLGLAIVQRTVHELGGVVWVDDAREGGAAFKIFLPGIGV